MQSGGQSRVGTGGQAENRLYGAVHGAQLCPAIESKG